MRLNDWKPAEIPPILEAYAYRRRGDHAPDELLLRIDCRMVLAVALRYQGGSLLLGSAFCKSPAFRHKGGGLMESQNPYFATRRIKRDPVFHPRVFE